MYSLVQEFLIYSVQILLLITYSSVSVSLSRPFYANIKNAADEPHHTACYPNNTYFVQRSNPP